MRHYSSWINWFRDVAPKAPGAAPANALGAPVHDAERLRRVMHGGKANTGVQNLSRIKSLSPAKRMINWLETQPAEVVDAAAQNLNWDRAEEVVLWLLGQSSTDAATAVKLFMRAEPAYYVRSKADNPSYGAAGFEEKVIQTFAAHWTAGRYARGGVGYDPSEVTPYGSSDVFFIKELNELTAKQSSEGVNPLPTLPGLAGPFKGPKPRELEVYLKQKGRGELFLARFLFAGLGTWIVDEEISEADFDEWMRKNDLGQD
jgi:hypothetical protein